MYSTNKYKLFLGITLIELLIVVLIVGVLTTLSTVAYQRYVYRARFESVRSDLLVLLKKTLIILSSRGICGSDSVDPTSAKYSISLTDHKYLSSYRIKTIPDRSGCLVAGVFKSASDSNNSIFSDKTIMLMSKNITGSRFMSVDCITDIPNSYVFDPANMKCIYDDDVASKLV